MSSKLVLDQFSEDHHCITAIHFEVKHNYRSLNYDLSSEQFEAQFALDVRDHPV